MRPALAHRSAQTATRRPRMLPSRISVERTPNEVVSTNAPGGVVSATCWTMNSQAATRPPGMSPAETLGMWLLGGALGVGAWLWAVGQVAGRLFGGAWPDVQFGEMGRVLLEFPKHLSEPDWRGRRRRAGFFRDPWGSTRSGC